MSNLQGTFDRVVVVNLARRIDRMERFWKTLGSDWPFHRPMRFDAVDGLAVPVPVEWKKGPGAWGCMLSHRQIVRSALADGLESVLILEDDAVPAPNFAHQAADFISNIPPDWDCLMLGGNHLSPPVRVSPGIVRCVSTNTTHAYAIRRSLMPGLLKFWESVTDDHCDIVLAACNPYFKFYAPNPFLLGQNEGKSDVTVFTYQMRFLSAAQRKLLNAA